MKNTLYAFALLVIVMACSSSRSTTADKWIPLFNGKNLDGWKVGENAETFSVDSGRIRVNGKRAHLFYDGSVSNHEFTNFHFKAEVMTTPGSNSGIYFHTKYQEKGWPSIGFEVQVNNSHTDWRRTGSLYAINDVRETYVKDNEWYTEEIIVVGKSVTVKLNGKTVVEFTEPTPPQLERRIGSGTFALQGHDPKSKVYYRNIMVMQLP
jgi:Domain of Unknown Function (DUF1080)